MRKIYILTTIIIVITSCNMNNKTTDNPLLKENSNLYGVPSFDKIENKHYLEAFNYALEMAREDIKNIAESTDAPTFENSVVALENSGEKLSEISEIFFNLNSCNTNEEMENLALEISPLITEYSNDILLNEKLFERIDQVYKNRDNLNLDKEDIRLIEKTYKNFTRNGSLLKEEEQKRYREITGELASLSLKFKQNLLAATNDYKMIITNKDSLDGLPSFVVDAAKEEAANKNIDGWLFTLNAPSYIPFMQYSNIRELREKLWKAYGGRAKDGKWSNIEILKRIAELRIEKAKLLGYKTHAHYTLEQRMAENPENVINFLDELTEKSMKYAINDVKTVEEYANKHGLEGKLEPWDFSYYSEKYKDEKYNLNDEMLKPYFRLEDAQEGMFSLANKLYGITFTPCNDIPTYHNDAKAYKVNDKDGSMLAILYLDYFPRESKGGGAWMTSFRELKHDNKGEEIRPIIQVVCNFTKPTSTSPSLLTFDEVSTMLHEFGHALHGIFSKGKYTSLSGTNVAWDFVELPSQIMENWALEPQYLNSWAKHYETGEKIPSDLIDKIVDSKNYLSCYATSRQLMFGYVDMAWHMLEDMTDCDVKEFEVKASEKVATLPTYNDILISSSFSHIFGGGYSSGYYSYKWAEVLEADAFKEFKDKGIFSKEVGGSFRENILSKGNSEDAMQLYIKFKGSKPNSDALIEKLGINN